jgi:hypothetical protein
MQGVTGSYAINGVELSQPSTGKWLGRENLGTDGNGRTIYPVLRSYLLSWDLMSTLELNQIINWNLSSVTGTVIMDLPKWGDANYTFYSYSGTVSKEPEVGEYFVTYVTNVSWEINNIRTN